MSDVILYTTEDGKTQIDLHLKDGTVWLSQQQIADLFQTSKQNISKHVKAIYEDQELDERATVNQQLTVQKEGSTFDVHFSPSSPNPQSPGPSPHFLRDASRPIRYGFVVSFKPLFRRSLLFPSTIKN